VVGGAAGSLLPRVRVIRVRWRDGVDADAAVDQRARRGQAADSASAARIDQQTRLLDVTPDRVDQLPCHPELVALPGFLDQPQSASFPETSAAARRAVPSVACQRRACSVARRASAG